MSTPFVRSAARRDGAARSRLLDAPRSDLHLSFSACRHISQVVERPSCTTMSFYNCSTLFRRRAAGRAASRSLRGRSGHLSHRPCLGPCGSRAAASTSTGPERQNARARRSAARSWPRGRAGEFVRAVPAALGRHVAPRSCRHAEFCTPQSPSCRGDLVAVGPSSNGQGSDVQCSRARPWKNSCHPGDRAAATGRVDRRSARAVGELVAGRTQPGRPAGRRAAVDGSEKRQLAVRVGPVCCGAGLGGSGCCGPGACGPRALWPGGYAGRSSRGCTGLGLRRSRVAPGLG